MKYTQYIYVPDSNKSYFTFEMSVSRPDNARWSEVEWMFYENQYSVPKPGKYQVTIKIDGKTVANNTQRNYNEYVGGTETFIHNPDGKRSFTLHIEVFLQNDQWYTYDGTVELKAIPNAAKISSVLDITLGNNCNVKWTSTDATFTYTLRFELGAWNSGDISGIKPPNLSEYTYSSYQIPISVANNITVSNTGTMTVYLTTYKDNTQIGAVDSKTFTVTVPASCKPNITKDSFKVYLDNSANAVVGKWGVYVAGYSKARLTASAVGQYGASISKYRITGGYGGVNGIDIPTGNNSLDYTGGTLTASNQVTFTIRAIDTRGMESDAVSSNITVHSSDNPTISTFTARRKEGDEEHVIVFADWAYSSIDGHNTATGKLQYKNAAGSRWENCTDVITDGVDVDLSPVFEQDSAYNVRLTVTDALGKQISKEVLLQTPFVLMDFRSGGKGLGVGGVATSDRFEIMLDTCFYNCKVFIRDDQGKEQTLEDYIKQVVRSMQT